VHAEQGRGDPVAWVTRDPVHDAGQLWSALSDAHPQTGLVPVLLGDYPGEDEQGLIFDSFCETPSSITELDHLDAAQVLRGMWDGELPADDTQGDGPYLVQARAPYAREFPGLAPEQHTPISPSLLHAALTGQEPSRVGLIPAGRPADALPSTGWTGPDEPGMTLQLAAVLRSWETRFGARLLKIGPGAVMQLLVERPPRDFDAAQHLAAEHFVFCDECAGQGLTDISEIAASLASAPTWTFWWD
jgi:hypothetical protein